MAERSVQGMATSNPKSFLLPFEHGQNRLVVGDEFLRPTFHRFLVALEMTDFQGVAVEFVNALHRHFLAVFLDVYVQFLWFLRRINRVSHFLASLKSDLVALERDFCFLVLSLRLSARDFHQAPGAFEFLL